VRHAATGRLAIVVRYGTRWGRTDAARVRFLDDPGETRWVPRAVLMREERP